MLRLVLCNCSPSQSAELAQKLVESRLAACVNVISNVTSYYEWKGEFCVDQEHTLLIKTTAQRYPELEAKLKQWHSYDVPEIIALDTVDALSDYVQWAKAQVSRRFAERP